MHLYLKAIYKCPGLLYRHHLIITILRLIVVVSLLAEES